MSLSLINRMLHGNCTLQEVYMKALIKFLPRIAWVRGRQLNKKRLKRMKDNFNRDGIHVLFIVIEPSMWKADSLYREMLRHESFTPMIMIVPNNLSTPDIRLATAARLRSFFDAKGYPYIDGINEEGWLGVERIAPQYDVLVYPQPYAYVVPPAIDFFANHERLWLCCHYAFHSVDDVWACNNVGQRYAWTDLCENDVVADGARRIRRYAADNIRVTGLPFADALLTKVPDSPWKPLPRDRKKIIWAPHWTIPTADSYLGHYSQFTEIAEQMRCFVADTRETIQWAFKPHPFLRNALYKNPDWGVEKTDAYYEWWQNGETSQLADGDYVPLFQHSDALVHDCSSFTCEYLVVDKPVCYVTKEPAVHEKGVNRQGRDSFRTHYFAGDMAAIRAFIQDVVLSGKDPKRAEREAFARKYVLDPMGLRDHPYGELFPAEAPCTAASRNIIREMLRFVKGE